MSSIDVDLVARTMTQYLARDGRPIVYHDRATEKDLVATSLAAGAPDGLLPALLVAGEAVWRETTGRGFALDIVRDPDALLGYRLRGIGAGTFSTVMLAAMEATEQVARPQAILIADLNAVWSAAHARIAQVARPALPSRGAAP